MYIADRENHRIRKVTVSTGIITTLAGNGGTGSYSGDDNQATSATLNYPAGVSLDSAGTSLLYQRRFFFFTFWLYNLGNVYIADEYNHRIRKVTVSTGIITTIAGSSTSGSYSGDNNFATSAALYNPFCVALDSAGTHSLTYLFTSFFVCYNFFFLIPR